MKSFLVTLTAVNALLLVFLLAQMRPVEANTDTYTWAVLSELVVKATEPARRS